MNTQRSQTAQKAGNPTIEIEHVTTELNTSDLNDLCDATDAAIEGGGGFGWTELPARETLERYWQGVIIMPTRDLFIARLDGAICGTCQLISPPQNNEAQVHILHVTTHFLTPWARQYGLARMLLHRAEKHAKSLKKSVINLDVRETQDIAIKLYESEGYDHYATHPAYAYVDGTYIPGRFYTKILDQV